MSESSFPEPEQEINISDTHNEGQIGVARRNVTQIQGDNNIQGNDNIITYFKTEIIQVPTQNIKKGLLIKTSPYKGLRKFEQKDDDKFFGRDQFLSGLVNDLEQSDSILLLGSSGSGKSSVVRAGLIPWLAEKWGTKFVNLTFTPDEDPFDSLYASLLGQYKQSEAKFVLQATAETLTQLVKTLKKPEDYWLILIDQFEELFTLSSEHQRNLFIESLVQLMKASNSSVKLIFTMRADLLDRIGAYPALGKLTQKHIRLMTDMQIDELRLAIEQPAILHGVVFENGLVEEIVKDLQGQAGYLPLLQYTLNLLWETEAKRSGFADRTLTIVTYRQLGGVRGALQQHVDLIYNNLLETEKLALQRIMLKLVDICGDEASGMEWKPVRRRALRSEFSEKLEQQVLMELINKNLLISNLQPQSQEATVEIAHEVLLISWASLHDWIKDNRQAIALRNRLNEDVLRWRKKKVEDELSIGSKLGHLP
jgi:energy-coupling factor transporter ATP-binding protein EcfA2